MTAEYCFRSRSRLLPPCVQGLGARKVELVHQAGESGDGGVITGFFAIGNHGVVLFTQNVQHTGRRKRQDTPSVK